MIIETDRGRRQRIPFGRGLRGLRIEDVIIKQDDIHDMLNMDDHELKRNLYDLLNCMRDSERGRPRDPRDLGFSDASDPYGDRNYHHERERLKHERMREQSRYITPNIPKASLPSGFFDESISPKPKQDTKPDKVTGLMWTED